MQTIKRLASAIGLVVIAGWLGGVVISDSEVVGSITTRTAILYTCGAQANSAFHPSEIGK